MTTPIAMEVSKATGGIPSLTAAVVVVVGLFGAVFGFKVLRVGHVGSPIAQGLSTVSYTHLRPCEGIIYLYMHIKRRNLLQAPPFLCFFVLLCDG